jgi:hypothetical protein
MKLRSRIAPLGLAAALALAACGDDDERAQDTTEDGGHPPEAPSFAPDPGSGARVFLRERELTDEGLTLDLVTTAEGALHGAAARLTFDPAVLAYAGFVAGPGFGASDVVLAREARPGLLFAALSRKGALAPIALDGRDRVLATLRFTKAGAGTTSVAFRAERCLLAGPAGERLAATFVGGTATFP